MVTSIRNKLSHPVNGYGLLVLLVVCFSLAGLGLVVSLSAVHDSERKFCALLANSHTRAQRALDAYRDAPPTTEAGRRQRDEVIIALSQLNQLERDLGCPPDQEEVGK